MLITEHALKRFNERARALGLKTGKEALVRLLRESTPEKMKGAARWNLFIRSVVHKKTAQYLVSDGWRFVVEGGRLVTVERVFPHEN